MSLSKISVYLRPNFCYEWDKLEENISPLNVYISALVDEKETKLYEVLVDKICEDNKECTMRVYLSTVQIPKFDYKDPHSEWDLFDYTLEELVDMFFGDIIEIDGEIDYDRISATRLANKIITEDYNNYGKEKHTDRIKKRVEIGLKLAYILKDRIGTIDNCILNNKEPTIYDYELLMGDCIRDIRGKQ